MSNTFVWVDIPVANLDRAIAFYSAVTAKPVDKIGGPGFNLAGDPPTPDRSPARRGLLGRLASRWAPPILPWC